MVVRWQAKMARDGHQWLVVVEAEVGGVGGGCRGREGERNGSFTLLDVFVTYNTRLGEIWLAWAS